MKIPRPTVTFVPGTSATGALEKFIAQPGPESQPVCPGCRQHLASCSAKCLDALSALSIDPERYPIEPSVMPLVFEMMATRVLETCWSCEGHMNEKNELWKIPQVCFYSPSEVYIKLIYQHLSELQQNKELNYQWHIVSTDFAQSNCLTYSIQPKLNQSDEAHLGKLQMDLKTIAKNMSQRLKSYARDMINTQ